MRFFKKKKRFYWFFLLLLFFFSQKTIIFSEKKIENNLSFHGGYIFQPFPQQKSLAIYISIFNKSSEDIYIERFESNIAENAMIHETRTVNDITKMRMIKKIKITAKSSFFMQPGGTHIMLSKLNKLPKEGELFKLKIFTNSGDIYSTNIMVVKPFEDSSNKLFDEKF